MEISERLNVPEIIRNLNSKRNDDPNQFQRDLEESNSIQNTEWWNTVHKTAFRNVVQVRPVLDKLTQSRGVDRVILTQAHEDAPIHKITIEEKLDQTSYHNMALETKSTARGDDEGTPGWINKPLISNLLAYGFAQRGEVHYFDTIEFMNLWKSNEVEWKRYYGERRVYSSHARVVPVPIDVIAGQMVNYRMICVKPLNN